jgi:hypothetical protein
VDYYEFEAGRARGDWLRLLARLVMEGSMMTQSTRTGFARALTVLALVALAPEVDAKPVTTTFKDVKVTFNKVNAADPNATSVYVKFEGGLNKFNAVVKADGFTVTPVGAGGVYQLTANAAVSIADGGTLTLRVKTNAGTLNGVRVGDVIFQDGAQKALANGFATGGALVGDPVYFAYNDLEYSSDLSIQNLRFYFNHVPVDPDAIDPAVALPGSFTSAANATLPGTGSVQDYPVPPIGVGFEFYAQGDVMVGGVRGAQFVDGFAVEEIPEPSTALLTALGLSGWMGWAGVRRTAQRAQSCAQARASALGIGG